MMNRRHFVKTAAMAGAGTLALRAKAWPFAQSPTNIRKFVVSVPGLGPSAKNEIGQYIPLATKRTINFAGQATDFYNVAVAKFSERMHPDLPGKTDLFGYADLTTFDQKYLGGAIVATRNTPPYPNGNESVASEAHSAGRSHHHGWTEWAHGRRPAAEQDCHSPVTL